MENPVEFQSPRGNCVLVVFGTEESRNGVALTLFDHLPLDLRNGSTIKYFISEPSRVRAVGLTHVVN